MDKMPIFSEKRAVNRLCNYWNELRGSRDFPKIDDIDNADISDIIDRCFIGIVKTDLVVQGSESADGPDFEFIYIGSEIRRLLGEELIYLNGSEDHIVEDKLMDNLQPVFIEMLELGEPVIQESEFVNSFDECIKSRYCILPLGQGDGISGFIGTIGAKKY